MKCLAQAQWQEQELNPGIKFLGHRLIILQLSYSTPCKWVHITRIERGAEDTGDCKVWYLSACSRRSAGDTSLPLRCDNNTGAYNRACVCWCTALCSTKNKYRAPPPALIHYPLLITILFAATPITLMIFLHTWQKLSWSSLSQSLNARSMNQSWKKLPIVRWKVACLKQYPVPTPHMRTTDQTAEPGEIFNSG